jgi:hypothetical protein
MDKNIAEPRGEAWIGNNFVFGKGGRWAKRIGLFCSSRRAVLPALTNEIASTAEVALCWHAASGQLHAGLIGGLLSYVMLGSVDPGPRGSARWRGL